MSWRFRQSFKLIPGLRVNVTTRGVSVTVGSSPLSVNIGPDGAHASLSIPGTGISNRFRITGDAELENLGHRHFQPTDHHGRLSSAEFPIEEIRSASTENLNSDSLDQMRELLRTARNERAEIQGAILHAERDFQSARDKFDDWDGGFLFKRILKTQFEIRRTSLSMATANLEELKEQLRLTTIATEINIQGEVAEAYFKMRDDFSALCRCERIWDTLSRKTVDRFRERSAATESVEREVVKFSLSKSELISWDQQVPFLKNHIGGDMYIYPGFVIYSASPQLFALIDFVEIGLNARLCKFIETGGYSIRKQNR